jgi:hypothetical protein
LPRSISGIAVVLTLAVTACGAGSAQARARDDVSAKPRQFGAGYVAYTDQPFTDSPLPKLQFEGDSITHQSAPDTYRHYTPRFNVAIRAQVGTTTTLEERNIEDQSDIPPDVEVINLGTNDAVSVQRGVTTLDNVLGRFTRIASEFPPNTCMVLVTVNTHNPTWAPTFAQAINDRLAQLATTRPHTVLADWNGAWQPSFFNQPDSPHPNERGRRAMLAVEDRAIAQCGKGVDA